MKNKCLLYNEIYEFAEGVFGMIYISNIKKEDNETYLFLPMSEVEQVKWLLLFAGCKEDDFHIYPRYSILKNKVEILKNISKEDIELEIDTMYGDESFLVKKTPAVLVSHFNKEQLFHAFKKIILDREIDPHYLEHLKKKQKEEKKQYYRELYVVKKGRKPWIYLHWLDAYRQIRGLKNVEFASFSYWTNIPDYDITGAPEEGGFVFALKEAEDYFFGENKPEKMPDWFFEYEDEFEDIDDFDEFSKEETSEIEEQEDEYAYQEPSYPAFEMEENEKQKINETPMFELAEKSAELGIALSASIVGQDSAIKKMENAYFNLLRREMMNEKNKGPRGVFLFAGPPGVGKTYMAQLFAEFHQEKFRRFDMSGYSHDGSVVGIVGLDGQYKGARPGEFTNFVKNNPNGIVLFDEIEKAHPDVIRLFLRVLDEGVCIDECDKEEIDCSGCTIIFTTNAGKQLYVDANDENLTELPDSVIIDALAKDINLETRTPYFPPEMISRLSSHTIVMFNHLSSDVIYKLVKKDVETHLKKTEGIYHIDVSQGSSIITQTIMYSIASNIDARKASKLAGRIIDKEIYEFVSMLKERGEHTDIERITWRIKSADNTDVLQMYQQEKDAVVVVFGDKNGEIQCASEHENITIKSVCSLDALREILQKENVCCAFIFYEYGLGLTENKLSLIDVPSRGRGAWMAIQKENKDIPTYILTNETVGHIYSRSERLAFQAKGILDFVEIKSFSEKLDEVCAACTCRKNVKKMISKRQVLNYHTSKTYDTHSKSGEIVFCDLKFEQVIEAEDKSAFLSAVERPNLTWDDIYVANDVKEELIYFINYLTNPVEYKKLGLRTPKGALMYGPPGTGKTSLAKIVAAESGMNFIVTTGADLLQGGSIAVEKVFRQARKYAPAVLFVDEIDAIGMSRNYGTVNVALNTLLTEMDGFAKLNDKPVFVMAATNMGKSLDSALRRRFDREFEVGLPDEYGRLWILSRSIEKHRDKFALSKEAIRSFVDRSYGLSIAMLGNIIEAALREAVRKSEKITDEMLDDVFEKILHGDAKVNVSKEDIIHTARHEAGHAIIHLYYGNEPEYMSVVSRSGFNGYVLAKNKNSHPTREDLLHRICAALGGRAAEMEFGYGRTPGASADIEFATKIAEDMVCRYGMYEEEVGLAVISAENIHNYPEAHKLVNQILMEQLSTAKEIIRKKKHIVEKMADAVCAKKYLTKADLIEIYNS